VGNSVVFVCLVYVFCLVFGCLVCVFCLVFLFLCGYFILTYFDILFLVSLFYCP